MSTALTSKLPDVTLVGDRLPVDTLIRRLRPIQRLAVRVSALSLFGDDRWDFSAEMPTRGREHVVLQFDIPLPNNSALTSAGVPRLVDSIKCLAYSLLFDPPRTDLSLTTISKAFKKGHGVGNLYWYLAVEGVETVSHLSEEQFLDLLDFFKKQPIAGDTEKPVSNRTLLGRLQGIEWIHQQRSKLEDRLSFEPWVQDGTCGRWAKKNAKVFVPRTELSTQPWSDQITRSLILAALKELGSVPELLTRVSAARSVRSLFTHSMTVGIHPAKSAAKPMLDMKLKGDYARLRSSVALLVGCLTGMRCSELLSIQGDPTEFCSVRSERVGQRVVTGHFISATLRKHQPIPKEEEWQTTPVALHAIALLADVNKLVSNQGTPFLFRTSTRQKSTTRGRELRGRTLVTGFNLLAQHHSIDLSEVSGKLSAMDLRRTFARLVTRSGLGLVELQSQLKHLDPGLTMLYGAPSTREYLTEEKENWTRDQYDELLRGDESLIGGGAKEVEETRKHFAGLTRMEKNAFLSALPKQALIDQVGDGLCLYRADRALCGGDKVNCRPAECGNSVIRVEGVVKTLRFRKQENERLLKLFVRQPAKRAHLKVQIATVNKLLDQAELKMREVSDV